ncbi:tRNA intron endonuclease [Colletotrichum falcatum]|nr:tRNA intron endonuclease [Colletotrichum falcatum]
MLPTKNTALPTAQAMTPDASQSTSDCTTTPRPKGLPLYKIYELPAPIRTFPLPSFYPNNPISLFHLLFAWTKQSLFPPPAEPSIVHEGIWSPESKSVNIIDERSMRALWEQGFYGKGNLSRSEPNWLKREQVRRGLVPGKVSELVTASRREERKQMKWERAKSEQEAIRQLRIREAQLATQVASADTVSPSTLAVEATESSPKLPSNYAPARETSTDAEPVPESPFPMPKHEPAVNAVQTDVPGVSQDAYQTTLGADLDVPGLSVEDDAPTTENTAARLINGVSSHHMPPSITAIHAATQQNVEAHIGSAKIVKPSDFLQSREEASFQSDIVLKTADQLPTPAPLTRAPVGPMELLALPNSDAFVASVEQRKDVLASVDVAIDRKVVLQSSATNGDFVSSVSATVSPVGPLELLSLPNSNTPLASETSVEATHTSDASCSENYVTGPRKLSTIHEDASLGVSESRSQAGSGHLINDLINSDKAVHVNGLNGVAKAAVASTPTEMPSTPKSSKRRKSVRFSPKVESATFEHSDPPSPSLALFNGINGKAAPPANGTPLGPGVLETGTKDIVKTSDSNRVEPLTKAEAETTEIVNKEHLQLTSEEAFFLSFGMGALRVVDPVSKAPIPTPELFNLFRSYSYFPSRAAGELQPDDGFLVNYAVYHHFRSLGWVPRAGIKFGVDWMLYARGPVFDHAEFGAIILPSYSDQWWKESDRQLPRKTWHWLHGIVRVLSHVQKSLVLVYVDVPPPPQFDEAMRKGPAEVFKLYKIREVMVKRWSSNRNR